MSSKASPSPLPEPRLKTIGVFDSGVGGLSVLRALLREIPEARFVYVADSGHAPYGGRTAQQVTERAARITQRLRAEHAVDALVVACNTATAHAIESLRADHPGLAIVGVEPALKPAAALSRSGHVGVLATRGTVQSERFARLRAAVQASAPRPLHFSVQACDGLADAIERFDTPAIDHLCEQYVGALMEQPSPIQPMDTLVLGCTHYPFASSTLARLCGPHVTLVETGLAVAQRTRAVLDLGKRNVEQLSPPELVLLSSGQAPLLEQAVERWLGRHATVGALGA